MPIEERLRHIEVILDRSQLGCALEKLEIAEAAGISLSPLRRLETVAQRASLARTEGGGGRLSSQVRLEVLVSEVRAPQVARALLQLARRGRSEGRPRVCSLRLSYRIGAGTPFSPRDPKIGSLRQ